MYIYLDEAERDVWVVAAIVTDAPRALTKLIRRSKKAKLPKKHQRFAEMKASQATDKFKRYLFTHLARLKDLQLYCIYLHKRDIPEHLRGQEGLIYLRMVIALLEQVGLTQSLQIYLYPDEKPLKGMTRQAFLITLKAHFAASFTRATRFEIVPRSSHEDEGIQAADFVTHAFFRKHQYQDTQWYDLVKPLVREEVNAAQVL